MGAPTHSVVKSWFQAYASRQGWNLDAFNYHIKLFYATTTCLGR